MPVGKVPRIALDDTRPDGPPVKRKRENGNHAHNLTNGKPHAIDTKGTNLKEITNSTSLTSPTTTKFAQAVNPRIEWSDFDRSFLHKYRREYQLQTPTAYSADYRSWVLSRSGAIGQSSPTYTRRQNTRRQSTASLSNTVRKHFSAQGIQETDAIVGFLHKVKAEKHAVGKGKKQPTLPNSATQRI